MSPASIPNLITIGRVLLVPMTVWLIISGAYGLAFLAFVVAGVSDGVDGYLARRMNARSDLGAHLDPLADKALLVSVYVTLGYLAMFPAWLVIAVVTRDVLIVSAFLLSWVMDKPMKAVPLMISKINTTGQIILAVAVLAAAALERDLSLLTNWGGLAVGLLTALSGGAYLLAWMRHMANGAEGVGGA